ncbi:Uncharacterised protein [uncultured Eubacterium sp.]|nr:Uncharacterised protein [uncultured Eubacterium sp.]
MITYQNLDEYDFKISENDMTIDISKKMSLEEMSKKIEAAGVDNINEVIDKLISNGKRTVTMV